MWCGMVGTVSVIWNGGDSECGVEWWGSECGVEWWGQ